ncbi:titin isoform X7 [Gossypium hirsutum]|uniref:Titin isoform X7 n=1 Tax=Gossypium hirsutum TaxID=3635 RepID=A0ABM3C0F4_GOSHI|nr:titin isoform X7 [Gossypium hirsutum]
MATEAAIIQEPVSIVEKIATESVIIQEPISIVEKMATGAVIIQEPISIVKTAESKHLTLEVAADNKGIETAHIITEGNTGISKGESFLVSPEISMVANETSGILEHTEVDGTPFKEEKILEDKEKTVVRIEEEDRTRDGIEKGDMDHGSEELEKQASMDSHNPIVNNLPSMVAESEEVACVHEPEENKCVNGENDASQDENLFDTSSIKKTKELHSQASDIRMENIVEECTREETGQCEIDEKTDQDFSTSNELCKDDANSESEKVAVDAIQAADKELAVTEASDEMEIDEESAIAMPKEYVTEAEHVSTPNEKPANPMNAVYKDANIDISGETAKTSTSIEEATSVKDHEDRSEGDGRETMSVKEVHEESEMEAPGTGKENPETKNHPIPDISDSSITDEIAEENMKQVESSLMKLTEEATNSKVTEMDSIEQRAKRDNDPSPFDEKESKEEIQQTLEEDLVRGSSFELKESRMDTEEETSVKEDEADGEKNVVAVKEIGLATTEHDMVSVEGANIDVNSMDFSVTCEKNVEAPKPQEEDGMQDKIPNAVSEDRMEMTTEDVPLKEAIGDEVKEHSTIPSEEYETTEERKITDETLEKDRAYKHLEKIAVDMEVVPDTDKKPAVTGALDEMKREEESTVLMPEGKPEEEIPIQQKNEPEKEMPSCPLNVVHEDVNTAVSRETTETSTSIREKTSVENHEERSEREGREDSSTKHQKNEVNQNTKTMELEISNDNADDLHVTDSSVQQSAENEYEKQFEFSDVQPNEQFNDAMVAVKEKEKVSEDASKASQSSDYTIPEHIFTETAATDLKSETSEMGNENTMFIKEAYHLNSGNGSECSEALNNKHKGIQQELNDHIEDNLKHEETKEVTEKLELDNTVENDGKQILEEDTNNDQITLKEACEGSETEALGTAKEEITLIEVKEELVCSSSFEPKESKMDTEEATAVKEHIDTADLDCTSQAAEMLQTNLKEAKAEAEEDEKKNEINNVVDGEDHGNGLGSADIDAKSAESCMTGEKDRDIPQEEDRMQDKILNAGSENQMEMTTDEILLKDILGDDVKEHSAMHSEENDATLLEVRKLVDETSEEDQAQQKHSENVVVDVKVVQVTGEELAITKGSEEMRKDKESIVPMPEGEISEVENIGLAQKNQEGNSKKDEILEESFKQKNEPEKENRACPWNAVSEDVNTAICAETAETSTGIEEATPVKDHDKRSEGQTREDSPTDHLQTKASQSNETVEVEISNENADDLHVTDSFVGQLMDNEHEKQYKFSDVEPVENEALEHKEESIQQESENRSALPKDAKENVEDNLNQEETKEVHEGSTFIVKEECAIINDSLKATEENENEATPEVEVCEKLEPDNTVENSEKQILEEEDNKKDQTTLMAETMDEKAKEENTAAVVSITEESKEEIAPIEVKEDHVPSSSVELGESKNDTKEENSASYTAETEETNIKEADAEQEKEKNQKCNVVVIEENSSARTEHEQIGVSSTEIDVKSGDSYVTHEKDMEIPKEEDAMQDKVRNEENEDQLEMTTKEIPLKEILGDEVKEYEATLIEERKITDETSEKDHDLCEHSETPVPQVTDEKLILNEDNPLADVPKAEPEDTGNESSHEVKEQLAEESNLDVTNVSTGEEHRELENQTDACKEKTLPAENSSDVGLERSKFEDGKPLDETMDLEATLGTCKDGEKATEEENSAKNIEKTESLKEDAEKEKENQIPEMVTMTYNAKVEDYSSVSTECFMEAESKEQIVAENLEVKEHSTNDVESSHITKELEEMSQAEESGDPVSLRSKDREAEEKTKEIIDDSKPCHEESRLEAVLEVTAETSLNDTDKIVNASNISSAETTVENIKSDAQETEVEIVQLEEISSESDPDVRTDENDEVQKQNLNMKTVDKDEAEVAEKLEPDNTVENDGKQILEEEDTNNNQITIEEVCEGPTLIVKEECAIINDSLKATEENENEATPEVEVSENLEPDSTVENTEKQILDEEDNKKDQTSLMTDTMKEKAEEEKNAAVVSITEASKEETTPIEVKEDHVCSLSLELKESKKDIEEETSASCVAETEEKKETEAHAEVEKGKNEINNVVVIEENSLARIEHEESGACSAELDVKSGDSHVTHEKDMGKEEDAMQDKVPNAGSEDQLEMTTKEIPLKEILGDEVKEYEATHIEERKRTDETSEKEQGSSEHSETPVPQITDEKSILTEDNPLVDVPKAKPEDTGNESRHEVEEQLAEKSNLEVTDDSSGEEHRELENQTDACEAETLPVENSSDVGLERSKFEDGKPLDGAMDLEATLGTSKDDKKATGEENLAKNIEKPESLKEETEMEKENQIPEMVITNYSAKVDDYSSVLTECVTEVETKEQIVAESLQVEEYLTSDGEASHITKEFEEMRQDEESRDPVSLHSEDREAEEKTEEIIDDSNLSYNESRIEAVTEVREETVGNLTQDHELVETKSEASKISKAELLGEIDHMGSPKTVLEVKLEEQIQTSYCSLLSETEASPVEKIEEEMQKDDEIKQECRGESSETKTIEEVCLSNEQTELKAVSEEETIADQASLTDGPVEQIQTTSSTLPSEESEHGTIDISEAIEYGKTKGEVPTKPDVLTGGVVTGEQTLSGNKPKEGPISTPLVFEEDNEENIRIEEEKIYEADMIPDKISEDLSVADTTTEICLEKEEFLELDDGKNDDTEKEDEKTNEGELIRNEIQEDAKEEKTALKICSQTERSFKPEAVAEDEMTVSETLTEKTSDEQIQNPSSALPSKEEECERTITDEMIESVKTQDYNEEDASLQKDRLQEDEALAVDDNASSEVIQTEKHKDLPNPADTLPTDHIHLTTAMLPSEVQGNERKETELEEDENTDKIPEQTREIEEASDFNKEIHEKASENELLNETEDAAIHKKLVKARTETGEIILNEVSTEKVILEAQKTSENENPIEDKTVEDPVQASDARIETTTATEENVELALACSEEKPESDSEPVAEDQSKEPIPEDTKNQDDETNTDAQNKETENQIKEEQKDKLKDEDSVNKDKNTNKVVSREQADGGEDTKEQVMEEESSTNEPEAMLEGETIISEVISKESEEHGAVIEEQKIKAESFEDEESSQSKSTKELQDALEDRAAAVHIVPGETSTDNLHSTTSTLPFEVKENETMETELKEEESTENIQEQTREIEEVLNFNKETCKRASDNELLTETEDAANEKKIVIARDETEGEEHQCKKTIEGNEITVDKDLDKEVMGNKEVTEISYSTSHLEEMIKDGSGEELKDKLVEDKKHEELIAETQKTSGNEIIENQIEDKTVEDPGQASVVKIETTSVTEENVAIAGFEEKSKSETEAVAEDQSKETIPEHTKNLDDEISIGVQNQETEEQIKEELKDKLEDEDSISSEQNTNVVTKAVILSEEVDKEVEKVDGIKEIKEHVMEEESSTNELHPVSKGDEETNEVKDYSAVSTECIKVAASKEQIKAEVEENSTNDKEGSGVTKEIEERRQDEDSRDPIKEHGEDREEEKIEEIIDDSKFCHEESPIEAVTEVIAGTSLNNTEVNEELENTANISSVKMSLETLESDSNQETKEIEKVQLEERSSNLAPEAPTNNNDEAEITERDLKAFYMPKDQIVEAENGLSVEKLEEVTGEQILETKIPKEGTTSFPLVSKEEEENVSSVKKIEEDKLSEADTSENISEDSFNAKEVAETCSEKEAIQELDDAKKDEAATAQCPQVEESSEQSLPSELTVENLKRGAEASEEEEEKVKEVEILEKERPQEPEAVMDQETIIVQASITEESQKIEANEEKRKEAKKLDDGKFEDSSAGETEKLNELQLVTREEIASGQSSSELTEENLKHGAEANEEEGEKVKEVELLEKEGPQEPKAVIDQETIIAQASLTEESQEIEANKEKGKETEKLHNGNHEDSSAGVTEELNELQLVKKEEIASDQSSSDKQLYISATAITSEMLEHEKKEKEDEKTNDRQIIKDGTEEDASDARTTAEICSQKDSSVKLEAFAEDEATAGTAEKIESEKKGEAEFSQDNGEDVILQKELLQEDEALAAENNTSLQTIPTEKPEEKILNPEEENMKEEETKIGEIDGVKTVEEISTEKDEIKEAKPVLEVGTDHLHITTSALPSEVQGDEMNDMESKDESPEKIQEKPGEVEEASNFKANTCEKALDNELLTEIEDAAIKENLVKARDGSGSEVNQCEKTNEGNEIPMNEVSIEQVKKNKKVTETTYSTSCSEELIKDGSGEDEVKENPTEGKTYGELVQEAQKTSEIEIIENQIEDKTFEDPSHASVSRIETITVTEENVEPALAGFEEKPKSDSEPVAEDQSNETIPEDTKSQDDETSQEIKEHITEELKDKLKDEDYINREENENKVTNVVVLSEKVDKEVEKADVSEAIKEHVMEEESSTNEIPPVSRGDEANKAKDYNSVSTECIKEAESREHIEAEQTEVERKSTHDKEGSHIIEELEERRQGEESTDPAKVSSEDREAEEKAEIIDDVKLCREESHIEVATDLRAQMSLNDAVNEELINTLNISSVKMGLETIKDDANQETKEVEMGQLEDISSDLALEVPLNDNNEVEVIKRDADALYMHKDQVAEPEKGPTAELEDNKTEDIEGVPETSSDYISQRVETILIDDIGSTNTLPEEKPDEQLQSSACTLLSEGENIRIANPIENIEEEIQKDAEIKHESREDSSDTKRIEEVRLPNEEQGELKAVETIADEGLPNVEPEEKIQTTFSTLASKESEHGTGAINEEIEYGKTKEEIPTKLDAVAGDGITGEQTLETNKPEEKTTSSPLVSDEEENVSKAEKMEEEKKNEADMSPDKISEDPSDAKKKAETCLEKQEFQELNDATNDETAAAQALQMEESNEQSLYLEFPVQNPKHEADASKEEEKVKEPEMLEKEGPGEPETKETEDEKTSEGEIIKDKTEEDASDAQITVEKSSHKRSSIGLEAVKEDEMTAGTAGKIECKKMEEAKFLRSDIRDDVTLQKEQLKEDEALAVDDNATSQTTATEKPKEQISNLVATLQFEEYKHKTVDEVGNTEEEDMKEKETENGHIDGVKKEEKISQEKDKIKEAEAILRGETNHHHITTSVLPSEVQRDETNKTEFKEDEGHEKIPELKGEVEEASNFKREIHEKAFDNELLNEETKDAAIKENIVKARDGTDGEENQCEQTNEGNEIILNEVSKEEVASYSTSHSEEPIKDEARENVGKDEPIEDNTFEEFIVEAQKTSENEIIEKQIKNAVVEDRGQASAVRIETTIESSSKISIAEGNQILNDIQQTDETTKTASDKQIPREFDHIENMEITSLVVREYVRIDLQDRVDPQKAEIGDVKEIYSGGIEHAGEKTVNNSSEEIIKESVSMEDLTKISSSDHVENFTKGTSQLTRDTIEKEAKDETDASRFLLVDKQENKYPAPVDAGEEKEQMEVETRDKDSSDMKIGDNICSEQEENKELKSVVEEKSIVIQPPQTKINEDLISHFEDGSKEDEHTGDKTKETFEVPTYEIQNEKPTLETPKDAARDNIKKETVAKDETVKDDMKEATIVEEIPGEKDSIECKKTTNSIGKQQFPTEQQDEASETSDKIVVGDLEPRNAQEIYSEAGPDNGKEKRPENEGAEKSEEPESEDSAKLSLYDLLQRSTRGLQGAKNVIEEKELVVSKEEPPEEEAKTDEDEGDENSKTEPGIKPHKKSHNILSGVGSKVKHSISKMKKAITGKSSHSKESKPISPKESKK